MLSKRMSEPDVQSDEHVAALPTLILLDDEPGVLAAYRALLGEPEQRPRVRSSRRKRASRVTQREVYRLILAATGEEAVAKVIEEHEAGRRIQAGFFDMKIPGGIDGAETISRILQIDPMIRCTIVTAYQDKPVEEIRRTIDAHTLQSWDYLCKPFSAAEIRQKAHNMVTQWRRRQAVDQRAKLLEKDTARATRDLEAALVELRESNERLHQEMCQRQQIERELRIAQKLEAVGQLAAGIAHEINTPTHFIASNIHFLDDATKTLLTSLDTVFSGAPLQPSDQKELEELRMEIPEALSAMHDGVEMIARIVSAMREFAHDGRGEMHCTDINRSLRNTLTMARSEYRHFASVECDFGDVPPITCRPSEVNQVFINLIINAAHAVADAQRAGKDAGRIHIRTLADDEWGVIIIEDDGVGIPIEIRDRVFDPFFTTKAIGRGTGQGLSIARRLVDKHGGTLTFESTVGRGTAFTIRLPIT